MADEKERIDAAVLAEALLRYALQPFSSELAGKCSQNYLEELLFLKMFSVDYVLGMRSFTQPAFGPVRAHYNDGLQGLCDPARASHISNDAIASRFAIFSEACNATTSTPNTHGEKRPDFWELGKEFCKLALDSDPWRPNAFEVVVHANLFLKDCLRLMQFLDQYEVIP
jgi:hypothetical protein